MKKPWHYIVFGYCKEELVFATMAHKKRNALWCAMALPTYSVKAGWYYPIDKTRIELKILWLKRRFTIREVSMI